MNTEKNGPRLIEVKKRMTRKDRIEASELKVAMETERLRQILMTISPHPDTGRLSVKPVANPWSADSVEPITARDKDGCLVTLFWRVHPGGEYTEIPFGRCPCCSKRNKDGREGLLVVDEASLSRRFQVSCIFCGTTYRLPRGH